MKMTFDEKFLIKKFKSIDLTDGFIGMVFMFETGKNKKIPLILTKIVNGVWTEMFHYVSVQKSDKYINDFYKLNKMVDKRNHIGQENTVVFLRHCSKKEAAKFNIDIAIGLLERYEEFYGEKL